MFLMLWKIPLPLYAASSIVYDAKQKYVLIGNLELVTDIYGFIVEPINSTDVVINKLQKLKCII